MSHSNTRSSTKIFLSSTGTNQVVNGTSTNTDISFYFDPIILSTSDTAHFVLGLEQASIPVSINMVNSTNNSMTINSNVYTIPVGNYTIAELITYLNTVYGAIQFVYNSITNKVQVTIVPAAVLVISGTATKLLGFTAGTYPDLAAGVYIFTGVVNLTSTTGIIIQLDNVKTSNRDNSFRTGATLARIPITCAPLRILQYFNATPFYTQISNRELTYLRVRLLNDDYSLLDLVGKPDWFMVIRVDYTDKTVVQDLPNEFKAMREEMNARQLADMIKNK